MNQIGIFQAAQVGMAGPSPLSLTGSGGFQVHSQLLGLAGRVSYGHSGLSTVWSGGGAVSGLSGYLGQPGYVQSSGAGYGSYAAYGQASAKLRAHMTYGGLQNNKMWDVWFDYKDGQKTQRRSPIVLDLNHNGKPDITGKNVVGDGRVDGPTTLFDLDPTKSSYSFKSRARRPGRGAPSVKGGHWQNNQYLDADKNVVGELIGKDYHWGKREAREKTEWLKKNGGDGMLVWDVNRDGKITSSKELFGNYDVDGKERFQNGYEKLAHYFDRNRDGFVDGAELQGLQIWKDTDADGVVDQGEMLSLQSQDIHGFDVANYNRKDMSSTYTTHTGPAQAHFSLDLQFGGHHGGQYGPFTPPPQVAPTLQSHLSTQIQQFQQQLAWQLQSLMTLLMQFSFQMGGAQWDAGTQAPLPPALPEPKTSEGNPKNWYFQHGKYKKESTDYGHVQYTENLRIEYDSKEKTGYVFAMVEGEWQLEEVRKDWGGKAASPILLDMDGDGAADVAGGEWKPHAERGDIGAHKVRFDLDGDGHKEVTEWTGGKDGLLLKLSQDQVKEYQGAGRLEVSGKELYGDEGGKYADGYAKMRTLSDQNRDGQLSGEELKGHYVWQDTDRDGVVDGGELRSAQEAGITKVKATHGGDYQSAFEMNGEERKSWDWWPTTWN